MAEAGWTREGFLRRVAGGAAGMVALGALGEGVAWGRGDAVRFHRFVSRPDLRAQYLTVRQSAPGRAPGLIFVSPNSGPGDRGTLILDDDGEVVWFRPTKPRTAMNFRTAIYKGKPVLTWWEGSTERGLGKGEHVVFDRSYREVARFPAGGGRESDLHEFLLTPRGTALVTSWETAPADLSAFGGPANGSVVGGLVQELEIPSARVLFEWRSLDHVAIEETHAAYKGHALDYFHINSIDLDPDGNLLVSARNTWAVYKLSRSTGEVIWRLGGKRSDFAMGKGTAFAWQHDARHHGRTNLISVFDDGAAPKVESQSRALVLALDQKRMRATLQHRFVHRPAVLAFALGSMQALPNGNWLVGWGTEPYITEYRPNGSVVFDLMLPEGGQNYRALRLPWSGRPTEPPALVARRTASGHTLYASWNGATEVASWRLETGSSASSLQVDSTLPKRRFETQLQVPAGTRYAAVTALDRNGKPLRRSRTIRLA
ncbi:MAG: arylsulfotransferase family protein [Gaiellaceae bacterium]